MSYKLTASQKARLDGEIIFHWPHWCASAAKCLFTTILAVLILCGAVASRMALVAIPLSKSDPYDVHKESKFLALVVILMVPYGVEFARSCWLHGFRHGHPWPSKIAIVMGFAVSVIEVFGLCYFTIAVLTLKELSSTQLILFTNAIFMLPAFKNFFKPREQMSYLNVLAFITIVLNFGGLAWSIYKFSELKTRVALPASLFLISVAWFSPLRKWQLQATRRSREAPYNLSLNANNEQSTERLTEFGDILLCTPIGCRSTLKSGILTSGIKLAAVPFVSAFFCHFYHVADLHSVSAYDLGPSMGFHWNYLWVNILSSFGVYLLGYLACSIGVQRQAFALPLLCVTPVCLFLSSARWACMSDTIRSTCGDVVGIDHYHVLIVGAILWLGMLCYVLLYNWKSQEVKMAKEKDLFLIPYSYNGIFAEQYLLLNREDMFVERPDITVYPVNQAEVFLCTTMYQEHPKVMEHYLRCLSRVYSSQGRYKSLETHIVFDDAFRDEDTLNEHAETFVDLCKEILKDSDTDAASLVDMPYGSQIVITFKNNMQIYVHFKDSKKVKKGKLWSQMMIMSWIIDTKRDSIIDPYNAYFFTCDGDVAFKHSSIEQLLDVMTRKSHVGGATCRVHAEGSGPVVWYQIFEYAIWHWMVKAAESVIGSVVCCSGCFSVFRLQALSEVLPVFSRPTENGADYIRKDLGEDRWLSCLLLKTGWILEYCSLAEVATLCPETFDDFFQQRRHWIASSFANTCHLIKNFRQVRHFNNKLSVFFFIYLVATVLFMIISPSVMIWMIAGSLYYISGSSVVLLSVSVTLMGLLLVYIAACLFTLPDVHSAFAKAGSYILSIVVFVLALGSLAHASANLKETLTSDDPPYYLDKMGITVSWLYIIIYAGVFTTAALLHPMELLCCLQSLWYFMCLPAFNIFLITYTVCNLDKSNSELEIQEGNVKWYLRFLEYYCKKKSNSSESSRTNCCGCFSTVRDMAEATISEAINVNEPPETCDRGEGVEDGDIPPESRIKKMKESDEEEEKKFEPERRYWEQLQMACLAPYDMHGLEVRKKQVFQIRGGALLVFSITNILWFIVDYGVLLSNPLGFASLTLFTAVVIVQFVAMVYHRLMTISDEVSRATFIPTLTGGTRPQEMATLLDGGRFVEEQRGPENY